MERSQDPARGLLTLWLHPLSSRRAPRCQSVVRLVVIAGHRHGTPHSPRLAAMTDHVTPTAPTPEEPAMALTEAVLNLWYGPNNLTWFKETKPLYDLIKKALADERRAGLKRAAEIARAGVPCNDVLHDERWCRTCADFEDANMAVAEAIDREAEK